MSRPTRRGASAPPRLKPHTTGQWFAYWGGRYWYFGTDRARAQAVFEGVGSEHPGCLRAWAAWRVTAERAREGGRAVRGGLRRRWRVAELVSELVDAKLAELGPDARGYYADCLRRFNAVLGWHFADELDAEALMAFRADLMDLGLKPKTVNHDLVAVRHLLTRAAELQRMPMIPLGALRSVPVEPSAPEVIGRAVLIELERRCRTVDANAAAHLRLTYLCCLRASEAVRLLRGEGEWIDCSPDRPGQRALPGALFRFDRGKTTRVTRRPRVIAVPPAARAALGACVRPLLGQGSIAQALGRVCGLTRTHSLRDSAASHLRGLGVEEGVVRLFLGHETNGVYARYVRPPYRALYDAASRLSW